VTDPLSPNRIFDPGPGWYTGDFHAHTHFSDGVHPPDELLALAQNENLDFVSITDHNTIAAHAKIDSAPIPVIRGVEMTLKIGHFNVFGIHDWPEWLDEMLPDENKHRMEVDWQDANAMMARCKAEGWLVSINHPLLPPWDWTHPDTLLDHLDALEIWNDPTWSDNGWANPAAVDYWTRLLNDGYRITALGGTDYHYPETKPGTYRPRISLPRTTVFVENLSAAMILEAVQQRRAYVSMGDTKLTFTAHHLGEVCAIGSDLGQVQGVVTFEIAVNADNPVGCAQLLKNGEIVADVKFEDGRTQAQWQSEIDPDESAWFRCDVKDAEDRYLAVTNPFFTGPLREPSLHRFGDFLD